MDKERRLRRDRKHKTPIIRRLFNSVVAIILIFFVGIIFISYKSIDLIYLLSAGVTSFQSADDIAALIESPSGDFLDKLDAIELSNEVSIEIFSKSGKLVYSSSYKGTVSIPPYDNAVAIPSEYIKDFTPYDVDTYKTDEGYRFELQTDDDSGINYLVFVKETNTGEKIKVYRQENSFDRNAKIAFIFISVVCSMSLILILIITLVFVRRFTKPLKDVNNVTKRIAKLDFSKECPPSNILEISQLSGNINEMSHSLENALNDIQEKNEKLQEDIEQEKTIEQLREVFISGVSHELKTPIAIIQGYAEGLKLYLESDPEMASNYCDIIISESDKMNQLTMKLLDIIKYESGEYRLYYDNFNLNDLIADWFDRNGKILEEKGITPINNIDPSFVAYGDSFILSTVVNNYLSNAVAHVSGDMHIRAYAEEINGIYRVSICNSGENIADKDIDKIWTSFYRADKSMSRAHGRFGLGLAIVAAIQKLHAKEYGVENIDGGVRFWFDVAKADENPTIR